MERARPDKGAWYLEEHTPTARHHDDKTARHPGNGLVRGTCASKFGQSIGRPVLQDIKVLAEDDQEPPPPAIDAQLVGRTMWVFCPEPEDATDLTTYPGGWWDGKITEYYTPEERNAVGARGCSSTVGRPTDLTVAVSKHQACSPEKTSFQRKVSPPVHAQRRPPMGGGAPCRHRRSRGPET